MARFTPGTGGTFRSEAEASSGPLPRGQAGGRSALLPGPGRGDAGLRFGGLSRRPPVP
jgi:hypothetical protein